MSLGREKANQPRPRPSSDPAIPGIFLARIAMPKHQSEGVQAAGFEGGVTICPIGIKEVV